MRLPHVRQADDPLLHRRLRRRREDHGDVDRVRAQSRVSVCHGSKVVCHGSKVLFEWCSSTPAQRTDAPCRSLTGTCTFAASHRYPRSSPWSLRPRASALRSPAALCFPAALLLTPTSPPPPSPPRTKWTRRVPYPVLIGHAASLTPYQSVTPRPSPRCSCARAWSKT